MLDTPLATLVILATWVAWGAAFVSVGAAIFPRGTAITGRTTDRAARWLVWFWSGWCIVVLFLQVWHFVLPVDSRAAAAVACIAAASAILRRPVLLDALRELRPQPLVTLAAAAIVLLCANLATGDVRITDTGLYHMQAARWNAAYPVVTGLGNLHGRLAYNNSSLLYAALVDIGPWAHRGHHIANGLLTVATLLPLVASLPQALAGPRPADAEHRANWLRHVARSLLVAPTMLHAYKHVTSLSPDLPAALLGTVIAVVLIDLCLAAVPSTKTVGRESLRRLAASGEPVGEGIRLLQRPNTQATLALIALLAATAITVKLSLVATGAAAAIVALWLARSKMSGVALTACVFAAALVPWCIRGVILSGYLAYPSQAVAFDVSWRVPNEWAEEDRRTIVAWAREPDSVPDEVLGNLRWVGPWFVRQLKDFFGVSLPAGLALACLVQSWRDRRRRHASSVPSAPRLSPAAVPSAAALIFLLATAPDLARFGGASMWIIAAVAATAWLAERQLTGDPVALRRACRCVFTVALAIALVTVGKIGRYVRLTEGLAAIPQAQHRTVRTDSGLKLYVPTDSDRAWDAPLPSTPYPKPQLTLRREGDLSGGFEHVEAGTRW